MCEDECAQCDSDTPPLPADIGDLCGVLESLHGLTDWKRLGLVLGLLYPTLRSIEKDSDRNDECKMEMLAAWLRQEDNVCQNGVPSWRVLQAALRRVGENELASRIAVSCIVMVCVL